MPKYSVSVRLTWEEFFEASSSEEATEMVKKQIPDCGWDNRVHRVFLLLKQPGKYFAMARLSLNELEAASPREAITQVKEKLTGGTWDKQLINIYPPLWGPFVCLLASEGES